MRTLGKQFGERRRQKSVPKRYAACVGMRDHAPVSKRRQVSTSNYDPEARTCLGDAVAKAREAAGYKYRTEFARAAGITSIRSLNMLENGESGVGQSILFAVGRALPNWTEDTPKIILEGGPIPPTVAEMPRPRYPSDLFERRARTEQEEAILEVEDMGDEGKWKVIFGLRRRDYDTRGSQNDRRQMG